MRKYKHILFATDLSKESKVIGQHAKEIADRLNAKLSIVHIITYYPIIYAGEYALPLDEEVRKDLEKRAEDTLKKEAKQLGIPNNQQHLKEGATTDAILDLIEKIKADLLIVGNHYNRPFALFLGSTAHSMFKNMPCDILAIHV